MNAGPAETRHDSEASVACLIFRHNQNPDFAVRSFGFEVHFDDLMKKPSNFNRQRVSVRGLLQVAGDNNYLWRDAEARETHRF